MDTEPGRDMHCCDGLPKAIKLTSNDVNVWAKIASDSSYLDRACKAFSATCDTATAHAGFKAQIISVNEATLECTAFVPHAQDAKLEAPYDLPESAKFTFPSFALSRSGGAETQLITIPAEDAPFQVGGGVYIDADGHNGVIVASAYTGVPKGWFINLAKFTLYETERWVEFSRALRAKFVGGIKAQALYITDEEVPVNIEKCDDLSFVDTLGAQCSNYTAGAWCNEHAEGTEAGCQAFGEAYPCDMPGGADGDGNSLGSRDAAGYQCCTCGGGQHEAPTTTKALLFQ